MGKQDVRERVWNTLEDEGVARFPFPPHGRIPNVAGAADAADRLAGTDEWASAETVKSNPDAPQLPVRRAALRAGKTVYVARPRLREAAPFLQLDPESIPPEEIDDATTVSGIDDYGEPVGPDGVEGVDLVVSGSVAVTPEGARIGKGEGYSDLEWALLRELDAVDEGTTVATTVHELQVRDGDAVPAPDDHDVPMDLVVTPERTLRTGTPFTRPSGVDWDALGDDRLEEIPVLAARAPEE